MRLRGISMTLRQLTTRILATILLGYAVVMGWTWQEKRTIQKRVYSLLSNSVVRVTHETGGGGTGFLTTSPSGIKLLVTNWHICRDQTVLVLDKGDGTEAQHGNVLYSEIKHDLCIVSPTEGDALQLGDEPAKLEPVFVLGHPMLDDQTPSEGNYVGEENVSIVTDVFNFLQLVVTCPEGTTMVPDVMQTYCAINMLVGKSTAIIFPGNSGSPIVDSDGKLVGVINSASSTTNRGNFVPVRFLKEVLARF